MDNLANRAMLNNLYSAKSKVKETVLDGNALGFTCASNANLIPAVLAYAHTNSLWVIIPVITHFYSCLPVACSFLACRQNMTLEAA